MANRRQKKKQLKKQQQKYLQQKKPDIRVGKLSNYELAQLYNKEVKRENKKRRANALRKEKFDYLVNAGFEPEQIKSSDLNKSWEYIQDYHSHSFDFNQVCKLKRNERMFIAYRDYSGEQDFNDIIADLSQLSNTELLNRLKQLNNTAPTYTGRGKKGSKSRGSSGKAGDYRFMVAKQEYIELFNREIYQKNKRKGSKKKRRWSHSERGEHTGFQVLKSGGRVSFDSYTPRNMLIIANAIMENVTEQDRTGFYNRFYAEMKKHNPAFTEILPAPRY